MTSEPSSGRESRLRDLLQRIANGEGTIERARELESLLATEFPYDPRFEDLETVLALFSPFPDPSGNLIDAKGLIAASKGVLSRLEGSRSEG
jgi:hypothetical protein